MQEEVPRISSLWRLKLIKVLPGAVRKQRRGGWVGACDSSVENPLIRPDPK